MKFPLIQLKSLLLKRLVYPVRQIGTGVSLKTLGTSIPESWVEGRTVKNVEVELVIKITDAETGAVYRGYAEFDSTGELTFPKDNTWAWPSGLAQSPFDLQIGV
jgi:hypothetical protein